MPLGPMQLSGVLDSLPIGITIIDPAGCILYFNQYATRFVNRKAEHIGRDIRACHKDAESVDRINTMLKTLRDGRETEVCYETRRGEVQLAVTVSRFERDGQLVGFIQSFIVQPV